MKQKLRVVLAQMNPLVGDIAGNLKQIESLAGRARDELGADIVVFPELALLGYPPEDLLLRPSLNARIERALDAVRNIDGVALVIGYPGVRDGALFNLAGVFYGGLCLLEYRKQCLPNYQVFDEKRYFREGTGTGCFEFKGHHIALSVCEDIWHPGPMASAKQAGAGLMLNINASPFHAGKEGLRQEVVAARAVEGDMSVVYVNMVGAQDELVFDGGSFVVSRQGHLIRSMPAFCEALSCVDFDEQSNPIPGQVSPSLSPEASVYEALVLGVRDYVNKNGFKGVVLGLSGGIDSALTLAIAVDALGADRVTAIMMPYLYTADISIEDAQAEAERLGVHFRIYSIEPIVESFLTVLAPELAGSPRDKTEENLQARSRGALLMAISNRKGLLVLTTGNKSEMSVGYATLYGDMAGGLDVLKDVPKMLVFRLSEYRNALTPDCPPIPQRVIDRPPSAELAPGQKDEDSLPPYPVLDEILRRYIEEDASAESIVASGFERETVYRVLRMVDLNEYKRRQAAVGPRITQRGFGKDRRYPITNGWLIGD